MFARLRNHEVDAKADADHLSKNQNFSCDFADARILFRAGISPFKGYRKSITYRIFSTSKPLWHQRPNLFPNLPDRLFQRLIGILSQPLGHRIRYRRKVGYLDLCLLYTSPSPRN